MNVAKGLFYTKDHEWVLLDGNEATIGITEFAQSELGEIVYVDVTSEGETIEKDDVFGSIEAVKTVSDLMMPVTGEVLEFNEKLEDSPELINSDPYGDGWIVKVLVDNVEDLNELLDAVAYKDFIGK